MTGYASAMELDPAPWLERDGAGRHSHVDGVYYGACTFAPRDGYEQSRDAYPSPTTPRPTEWGIRGTRR